MNPAPETPDWEHLVSTALIGTTRRSVATVAGMPARDEDAEALLDLAALDTIRRQAGYTAHAATPIAPDAPDPRPRVGDTAARLLDLVLSSHPDLLPEWLELAARSGRGVPYERLPDLLDRAYRTAVLRPAVAAAAGPRGAWLAGLNPVWSFVTAEPLPGDTFDEETWKAGGPEERRRTLLALRAQDPAAAGSLLAEAWPGESKAEVRQALLDALEPHLGPDDEPLLETALDDRGAGVRGRALALLSRLPDSAHAHRLRDHLRRRLRVDRDTSWVFEVDTPEASETGLFRDLALAVPTETKESPREPRERVQVLIVHTPLDVWTERLDTDPAGVLALAAAHPETRDALVDAVCLRGDADWSRAVLDDPEIGLAAVAGDDADGRGRQRLRVLFAPLPAAERCDRVLALLEGITYPEALGRLLLAIDAPWTPGLSEGVARWTARTTERRRVRGHRLLYETIAAHMPPEHLALLPEQAPYEKEADVYFRLRETLRLRQDMHKEL